jgi:GH25 family lysozyme M1 (1,4-beta-N-acetylmuramidase)
MGIIWDGSKYQANEVDFSKLAGEIDLAILRDQYGYTTLDTSYTTFVSECKKYGIPFNTYAFFAAVSTSDAVAEAKSDNSRMDKASVVAWIDVETMSIKSGKDSDLQAAVNAYYDELKADGWSKVGLYSGEYFYNSHGLANCKKDCLWLAAYGTNNGTMQTAYRPQVSGVDLWQYTSVGKLAAVNGNCDLSILVGSKPLSYFTGKTDPQPVRACIDEPLPGATLQGSAAVRGWALDEKGVDSIDILIDGNVVGQATLGGSRPDVEKAYPLYNTSTSGFDYHLDATTIAPGAHTLAIKVHGKTGELTTATNAITVVAQAPEAAPTETKTSEPAPAPMDAQTVAVSGDTQTPSQVYITVPNLEGSKLGDVHDYIMNRGWWIKITKNDDDTLNLEVGIFIKDSKPYNDFLNFLKDGDYHYTESDHE